SLEPEAEAIVSVLAYDGLWAYLDAPRRASPKYASGTVIDVPRRLDGLLGINAFVDGDGEERRKHLLPSHVAEVNGPVRIGIELVVRRIVVMRGNDHFGALRHLDRLREIVAELPIEIVAGDVQDNLFLPIGEDQRVFHVFSAHMHMRRHPMQLRICKEREH